MKEFTPAVIDFVWDFALSDVQKVLKCSAEEAKVALKKAVDSHGRKASTNQGKHYYKAKPPVPVKEDPPVKPTKRIKGTYSNHSALDTWKKYM